ncbi:MAG TPA: ATP-dependent DNA helicase, partial [Burkholderiaceae bacterium]|nr:ATP-dependent DNA helicase [Burkholderiaceae bacterium]
NLGFLSQAEFDAQPEWRALLDELTTAKRATRMLAISGAHVVVAAERLPEFVGLLPCTDLMPAIEAPIQYQKVWTRDDALVEILRDRLQGLGPVTAIALASPLCLDACEVETTLARLEAEGSVMRGQFNSDVRETEWCERRLLARIHRYTVNRLRREIEPVEARDFARFLFEWQRVAPEARVEGADAVANIVSQLEGFEAPAAAWETEILPARVNEYDPAWLDELSRSGRVVWTRIAPLNTGNGASGERAPSPVRTTPIALASRRNLALWATLALDESEVTLTSNAQQVKEFITAHGASFFEEIVEGTTLLRTQVEQALAELVAQGLINADSFGGLRALLVPSDRRRTFDGHKRLRRTALFGIEDAGRWALVRQRRAPEGADVVEHVARTLLRRYGVVFWRLIAREAEWLPPWRDLLRCYRRLEARGEIRGGRFVIGPSGEQFAVPEAIGLLRDTRRREPSGALISLSGADPLNLVGLLSPGARLPALTGNRVLYRDGVPIALLIAGEARFLEQLEPEAEWAARNALLRRPVPPTLKFLA